MQWIAELFRNWRLRRVARYRPQIIHDPWRASYYRGDEACEPFAFEWLPMQRADMLEIAGWEDEMVTMRAEKGDELSEAELTREFIEKEDAHIARRIRMGGRQVTPETVAQLGGRSIAAVEFLKQVLFKDYFRDVERGLRGKGLRRRWRYMSLALSSR